ncbi:tudor domain-containing protein 6-like isoform X3 [Bradysia coprophila]|uniref:tudor domain-containing protein 6-like isoform X3 n=1 Tax=Bradysia coprophila TaxID=38358 RepID=UPI00187D7984|nr:tudor domain-containing protein 6-like isoform X3 [Bradysia coprophila]
MNECAVCYKESELLCQRCRIPYCSRRCQAEDWPEHKATCIPMPLLVAVKKPESSNSKHQLNESVSSVSRRLKRYENNSEQTLKQQGNVSESKMPESPKSKHQLNESDSNVSQRLKRYANDSEQTPKQQGNVPELQKPKQEAPEEEATLRPPKTKLPSDIMSQADTKDATSLFDNPFKRNSQNIGFNTNDNQNRLSCPAARIPSSNQTKKSEAQPTPGESDHKPAIISETAFPAALKSSVDDETEKAEIITQDSFQNLSLNEKKVEVVETEQAVESKKEIFTVNDIEIVPLIPDKKIVCLDASHIEEGYVSACLNDGKAVAFIDRMSSKIGEYCVSQTNGFYRPQTGEVCLCLFDEDNEWYRAVVMNTIDADYFEINFIDFGNSSTVCSENIRKMPRKFLHPCLVNKCYIRDFDDASIETKFKIEKFFSTNTIFEVKNMVPLARGVYAFELDC